ncbi:MAG: hypothetical protein H7Z15_13965 [Rhizobacter sp.]|nr:hypothetical protein [Rhizobacter sp.]
MSFTLKVIKVAPQAVEQGCLEDSASADFLLCCSPHSGSPDVQVDIATPLGCCQLAVLEVASTSRRLLLSLAKGETITQETSTL